MFLSVLDFFDQIVCNRVHQYYIHVLYQVEYNYLYLLVLIDLLKLELLFEILLLMIYYEFFLTFLHEQ